MNLSQVKVSLVILLLAIFLTACETKNDLNNEVESSTIKTNAGNKEAMTESTKNTEELIPLFIPSLSATLLASERKKGSPLTKQEVINIRDNSPTIMTPRSMIKAMAEKRGYEDIDPESAWEEWQLLRKTLDTGMDTTDESDHDALVLTRQADDPAMRKAEIKARNTLSNFRKLIKQHPEIVPMVKLRIVEENTSSRMWLFVDKAEEDHFKAHLFEVPSDFEEYQAGDKFTIKDEDILDWMINDNGVVSGAYTIRVQREGMSEKKRQELDEYMGIAKYLD